MILVSSNLADIHSKLQQIESAKEGTGTVHLNNAIAEVDVVAKRAFAPLLERQVQTYVLHFSSSCYNVTSEMFSPM
jgi:exocyst complex component 2